jgi:hypothetical protein
LKVVAGRYGITIIGTPDANLIDLSDIVVLYSLIEASDLLDIKYNCFSIFRVSNIRIFIHDYLNKI